MISASLSPLSVINLRIVYACNPDMYSSQKRDNSFDSILEKRNKRKIKKWPTSLKKIYEEQLIIQVQ